MKRTPLKRIGKQTKINIKENKKIEATATQDGIYFCEVCAILADLGLLEWQCLQSKSNAHRHSRDWYKRKPKLLSDKTQWVFACMNAHNFIDRNKEVKEEVFLALRGEETN